MSIFDDFEEWHREAMVEYEAKRERRRAFFRIMVRRLLGGLGVLGMFSFPWMLLVFVIWAIDGGTLVEGGYWDTLGVASLFLFQSLCAIAVFVGGYAIFLGLLGLWGKGMGWLLEELRDTFRSEDE